MHTSNTLFEKNQLPGECNSILCGECERNNEDKATDDANQTSVRSLEKFRPRSQRSSALVFHAPVVFSNNGIAYQTGSTTTYEVNLVSIGLHAQTVSFVS